MYVFQDGFPMWIWYGLAMILILFRYLWYCGQGMQHSYQIVITMPMQWKPQALFLAMFIPYPWTRTTRVLESKPWNRFIFPNWILHDLGCLNNRSWVIPICFSDSMARLWHRYKVKPCSPRGWILATLHSSFLMSATMPRGKAQWASFSRTGSVHGS